MAVVVGPPPRTAPGFYLPLFLLWVSVKMEGHGDPTPKEFYLALKRLLKANWLGNETHENKQFWIITT